MDLGSLELQIFVSLTVVLGGAFVALVCDYLKGNNEQLREHNIELRVRKEEQERRLLLDPAGFFGQWMPGQRQAAARTASANQGSARPAAPHEVMQSFAAPDALAEAEERAARLHARSGDDSLSADESFASSDIPPMTQRRGGRNRSNRRPNRDARKAGEKYADWVRPEVIARVARRAEASAVYASDIRDELESIPDDVRPAPLNAAENWDIRSQLPSREKAGRDHSSRPSAPVTDTSRNTLDPQTAVATLTAPETSNQPMVAAAELAREQALIEVAPPERLAPEDASRLQLEIERVAQLERQPLAPAPGTILRPLTVPSLKLETELQRVAEQAATSVAAQAVWNSALLDEVIAASSSRSSELDTVELTEAIEPEVVTIAPAAVPEVQLPVMVIDLPAPPPALPELEFSATDAVSVAAEIEQPEITVELPAPPPALPELEFSATDAVSVAAEIEQPEITVELPAPPPALPELEFSATDAVSVAAEIEQPEITVELPAPPPALPELEFSAPDAVSVAAEIEQPEIAVELPAPPPALPELEFPVTDAVSVAAEIEQPEITVELPAPPPALPELEFPATDAVSVAAEIEQPEIAVELPALPKLEFPATDAVSVAAEIEQPEITVELPAPPPALPELEFSATDAASVAAEVEQPEITVELPAPPPALPELEFSATDAASVAAEVEQPETTVELPAPPPALPELEFTLVSPLDSDELSPVLAPWAPLALLNPATGDTELSHSLRELQEAQHAGSETPHLAADAPVSSDHDLLILPAAILDEPGPAVSNFEIPIARDSHSSERELIFASTDPISLASEVPLLGGGVEPPPFVYVVEADSLPVPATLPEPELLLADSEYDLIESNQAIEPPPFANELEVTSASIPLEGVVPEDAVAPSEPASAQEILSYYHFGSRPSHLAGMGISLSVDHLPCSPCVDLPAVTLRLTDEPALLPDVAAVEAESALPDLLPAYADLNWETELVAALPEPPPVWTVPEPKADVEQRQPSAPPIDISAIRQIDAEPVTPAHHSIPDLLLPTGMHDVSTWARLLSLPNPMTGILFVITLQPSDGRSLPPAKGTSPVEDNGPAIDKLMSSFVREGDFGTRTSDTEWVFVYSNDVAGFNQRRVGLISEKLWDFQLRHLGMSNVSFKWGAIDVQSEPLAAALDAARDRMNQTRRARKLPGPDSVAPRRVVNA